MKNPLIRFALLFVVTLYVVGCDTANTPDNSDHYTGSNGEHFDARLDGKDWYAQSTINFGCFPAGPLQLSYNTVTFNLSIYGNKGNLIIWVDSFHDVGTYKLTGTPSIKFGSRRVGDPSTGSWAYYNVGPDEYYTDSLRTGTLEITQKDTAKRLITGTVSFDAVKGDTVIHLREGTFIAKY